MQAPRTKRKSYVPLNFLVSQRETTLNKCDIKIVDNKMYIDDREVNGLLFCEGNFVLIKAQSFTSRETASEIRTQRRFLPLKGGNYFYFIEDGFYSLSQEEIRHVTGASSAEVKFEVKFSVESERLWVKIERNHPVKFAVEGGLSSDEIIEIALERLPRSY